MQRDVTALKLRKGERLVTLGNYEGRPQRVHIAGRRDTRYQGYETLCGFFCTHIGGWGTWMRPSLTTDVTCKKCIKKASVRG